MGLLTGFLGVGGGFLIVPAMVVFARLAFKDAVGTSLGVIAVNSIGGLAAHLSMHPLDVWLTGLLMGAAIGGVGGMGAFMETKCSDWNSSDLVFKKENR